jgi:kynurenine formamidase
MLAEMHRTSVQWMGGLPKYRDLPERAGLKSSWGVWGDVGTDVFGCLNLLTPERAAAASAFVKRGAAFALNWTMRFPSPPLFDRSEFRHEVIVRPGSQARDDVLDGWNTQSSSQWDGFRHFKNFRAETDEPGTGHYGGVPEERHGVDHWARRGIVGRAVLADVGRWREQTGRPVRYDRADVVEPDELLECLAAQGTAVEVGDVLLMRTGWVGWYEQQGDDVRRRLARRADMVAPGLRSVERTAEVLWDLHIAAIGTDTPGVEVWPPGSGEDAAYRRASEADDRLRHRVFAHMLLLPMLGLPLGEMWNLEALAADCAEDGRYESFFTSAPLNLPGGVASPPNAIAIK